MINYIKRIEIFEYHIYDRYIDNLTVVHTTVTKYCSYSLITQMERNRKL